MDWSQLLIDSVKLGSEFKGLLTVLSSQHFQQLPCRLAAELQGQLGFPPSVHLATLLCVDRVQVEVRFNMTRVDP